jgi:hypothetical protein
VTEKTHRGVDDPEQDWILGELIRYLEHDASGAMAFEDMGPNWNDVRDGARHGTLNLKADEVADIAQRWDQLLGFVSLRLGSDIGEDVTEIVPRAEQLDPRLRTRHFIEEMCNHGTLSGTLRIPATIGDLETTVDLKARQITTSVTFDAPSDKKARGRVGWLLRQLKDCPERLVVEGYPKNSRNGVAASLEAVREDQQVLADPSGKPASKFRLIARSEMGQGRKGGKTARVCAIGGGRCREFLWRRAPEPHAVPGEGSATEAATTDVRSQGARSSNRRVGRAGAWVGRSTERNRANRDSDAEFVEYIVLTHTRSPACVPVEPRTHCGLHKKRH